MSEKVEIYIKHNEIMKAIEKMAEELNNEYGDKFPVFIVILKGAFMFASELMKRINCPLNIDFMTVSSYGPYTKSSGNVRIEEDIKINIENRHVVIIEDIIDTGQTVSKIKQKILVNNPLSLKLVTLLDKSSRRIVNENPDYRCFEIEDHFVVGFGLDYNQMYRNLPYIGILTEVK